ncbi:MULTISPECIES: hypothetical protein [Lysinibacillus]|uniref:Uncharacterized protein n=1 Tax=Lysinibacillus sphaericus TaxID=1421 RepID=A0A544ULK6_LYSSH|nr:hypothetical protein [Lysinibacillus sp. SDF0037]TQR34374.1 hypothetical protein C7Y47_10410 [Lysinibacillus sp. SDF0037]
MIINQDLLLDNIEELLELKNLFANQINTEDYYNWIEKVEKIIHTIKSNNSPELFFNEINTLTMEIREIWMSYVQNITNKHLKSPPLNTIKKLPQSNKISFSYERNIQPDFLEEKISLYRDVHANWELSNVLCSSGMAAISTVLQSYFAMYKPSESKKLVVSTWSEYFETRVLTDLYRSEAIEITSYRKQNEFFNWVESTDVFFIELVRYNWDLEVFNLNKFLETLCNSTPNRLRVLIVDTTLSGNYHQIEKILKSLENYPYIIVIQVHSILKLDQQGLELSNGGVISVYTLKNNLDIPNAKVFTNYIRQVRTILGAGLTYQELALLDNRFVFNKELYTRYCNLIYENNKLLAEKIQADGLFKKVVHPSLISNFEWAKSPFVVFHLKEDNLDNHGFLLGVLAYEVKKRKINFYHGSSFGFRDSRYEVIIPNTIESKGLFKIAMGLRRGVDQIKTIELMQEVANYRNFLELRNAYPFVNPIKF